MDDKFVGKTNEVLKQMRMAVNPKGPTFAILQQKLFIQNITITINVIPNL